MAHRDRFYLWCVAVLAVSVIAGCSKGPTFVHASGKVLYRNGSTIKGGVREIRFEPSRDIPSQGLRTAAGQIGEDGTFQLFTRRTDGIMPGTYNVEVSVWKGTHEPISLIDEKYSASATTPFKNVKIEHDQDDLKFEIDPLPTAKTAPYAAEATKPQAQP
jgi:hypothetical protein